MHHAGLNGFDFFPTVKKEDTKIELSTLKVDVSVILPNKLRWSVRQ